ncbi:repetitive organellar protein-like [Microplitis mediator]|uniref:repetitive organellar protein-like n=1 Tax=Microplitis mediator TaxID=375433 RepID=UPI002552951F|nr:repetitive organellar protein-like [Microplitis mediator]
MADLLNKEKEFRRINRELDKKTNKLLEEIDTVVNNQTKNYFSSETLNKFQSDLSKNFNYDNFDYKLYGNNDELILKSDFDDRQQNERRDSILDEDIFENKNKKNNESIIKILKAKIKILTSELDIIKDELKKKCNVIKELENDNKKINETKDKLGTQVMTLKESINKLENTISNQQTELQTRSNENNSLKKEIQSLKKEIKNMNQQLNNLDLRLNRSLEENDKLKNVIKLNKIEEKNNIDKIRKLEDNARVAVKNNERQYFEIIQAFKKQSLLIDNLKKQKAYFETNKQIQLTRDDFLKILKTYM